MLSAMSSTTAAPVILPRDGTPMTMEEFLALPDDGIERDLIRGRLRVWSEESGVTRRNFSHSRTLMKIGYVLQRWLDGRPQPRGEVVGGEAGFRLLREPVTTVGVDVAYISAEQAAATPKNARLIEGSPVLAVEVLSPSDKHEDVAEKIEQYLLAGTALVWLVDPVFGTVTVHRGDAQPQLFNTDDELTAEPHLPGFRILVAEIFGVAS